jgi:hypothetical protein
MATDPVCGMAIDQIGNPTAPADSVMAVATSIGRGGVGAEEIRDRHDPDQPAVVLHQDVPQLVLHHGLGDLGDRRRGVAPHDIGAGHILHGCPGGVSAGGDGPHGVPRGHEASTQSGVPTDERADLVGGEVLRHVEQGGVGRDHGDGVGAEHANRR